ncbi:MAG: transporter substrate-binding domain-containing protein [Rhodobacterales bacterium]|nr:transporter substrate-binding domain-containing protein [Rhodobacterales bacterium]
MTMKSVLKGVLAAAATILTITTAQAQTSVDDIRDRGTLRMAGILNEPPYFARDPRTGEWTGFAVAMGRDIAETMGVELEVVESSWANSILDVQSGRADIALALTALPTRALSINFSSPTYFNSFVIVSPKEEMAGRSWADLNDPDLTFAVDLGSAQDNITRQYLPDAKVLRFQTRDEAIVAVATGRADALVNTVLNGMVMTKRNEALGKVHVPTPMLSSPSVIGIHHASDVVFQRFISAWADYNRRVGNNQTWIVESLAPFGIAFSDLPAGFDLGG